jgi:undecaprenyl-diphosphatase
MIMLERLLSGSKQRAGLDALRWQDALAIGFFQCLSLWPGVSRAAATIFGALLVGLERRTAAEYSFLAAVPVLCVATIYDLLKSLNVLHPSDIPVFAIGFVCAFLSAVVAIRFFIRLVSSYTLAPFGWYRIAIALLVFLLMQG